MQLSLLSSHSNGMTRCPEFIYSLSLISKIPHHSIPAEIIDLQPLFTAFFPTKRGNFQNCFKRRQFYTLTTNQFNRLTTKGQTKVCKLIWLKQSQATTNCSGLLLRPTMTTSHALSIPTKSPLFHFLKSPHIAIINSLLAQPGNLSKYQRYFTSHFFLNTWRCNYNNLTAGFSNHSCTKMHVAPGSCLHVCLLWTRIFV